MVTKSKQSKTIILPLDEEKYSDFVKNKETAHQIIGDLIKKHPKLFPEDLAEKGYSRLVHVSEYIWKSDIINTSNLSHTQNKSNALPLKNLSTND